MRKIFGLLAAVAVVSVAPSIASAQATATGNVDATATVLQAISITPSQTLAFGKVGQGVNKQVQSDDPTSGRFTVKGQGNANFKLVMVLPSVLVSADNDELTIDTYEAKHVDGADAAAGTAYVPVSGQDQLYTLPGAASDADQLKSFRIGATVRPTALQAAGVYTAQIGLTATYLDI